MAELCPACAGEGRALSLVVQQQFQLYRCRRCGTQFFRPNAGVDAHTESEYWEAHKFAFYNEAATRAAFARRYDRMFDVAEQAVGPVRTVLDVGCGTGNFLSYAQSKGLDAYGVDLDPEPVADARSRGLNAFTLDELDGAQLPARFDALTLWDVIEHIMEPLDALQAVLPRLRPGGVLLFETPDGGFPVRRAVLAAHRVSNGRRDFTRPLYYWEHKVYFTMTGLRTLLGRAGCEVLDVRRASSVREKMTAVFAYEGNRTHSRGLTTMSRVFPVMSRAAERAGVGNKLLVVARQKS